MAKVSSVKKDERRRNMVKNQEVSRDALKDIANDVKQPYEARIEAMIKLSEKPRNSSKVRVHNRCMLTGRPHAYYGFFKLSRIELRRLANLGLIPGVKKSSW
ncbi:MAG: 30S ribosomal protein S14 [Rickettsiales bacterium]|jgi:small subunit ribosomal protein S14|nr:30S ribosomal protein S14 [Rickettsiales bacterium]